MANVPTIWSINLEQNAAATELLYLACLHKEPLKCTAVEICIWVLLDFLTLIYTWFVLVMSAKRRGHVDNGC